MTDKEKAQQIRKQLFEAKKNASLTKGENTLPKKGNKIDVKKIAEKTQTVSAKNKVKENKPLTKIQQQPKFDKEAWQKNQEAKQATIDKKSEKVKIAQKLQTTKGKSQDAKPKKKVKPKAPVIKKGR